MKDKFKAWCDGHTEKTRVVDMIPMPQVVQDALDALKAETAELKAERLELHRLNVEAGHMIERLRVVTRELMVLRNNL